MFKRVISLITCLSVFSTVFFSFPFAVGAQTEHASLFDRPFDSGDWIGSTAKITDTGLFAAVTSDGSTAYLQSNSKYSLGDDFVIDVTSYINNQNTTYDKYSLIGMGDFAFVVSPYTMTGSSTRTNHYYVLYKFPKSSVYSTNSAAKFSSLTDYIVWSSDDTVAQGYEYNTTVNISIAFADDVLSFYANDELLCRLGIDDIAAYDNNFSDFDFNNISIGFRLYHTYKVHSNGAYFKDLKIRCKPDSNIVYDLIENLPDTITTTHDDMIAMIGSMYDSLSDSDKALVINYSVLTEAEIKLTDAFISELPAYISSADGNKLDKCIELYASLTDEQKSALSEYSKLVRCAGEFSVIDIIESIDTIGDISYHTVYKYSAIKKKLVCLDDVKLGYVRNYNKFIEVENALISLKNGISAAQLISNIAALPEVSFDPDAEDYIDLVKNIDLDYVADIELIRAKINVYGQHRDITNYNDFLNKELELYYAMLAFNDIAGSKLHLAKYEYYEDVEPGEYASFDAGTVIYAGDTVHITGLQHCNGVSPSGVSYATLYNVAYTYNGGTMSDSYQPLNGACKLRDLKEGRYQVYHKTYNSADPDYVLFTFNVVARPEYNYELFDVSTMLDHTIASYDDVRYSEKDAVAAIWALYDSLSVFDIDRVHSIRNLVDADTYFDDVDAGIIVEEPEQTVDVVLGDLNFDRSIDSSDLLMITQYLVGLIDFDVSQYTAANFDRSGDNAISSSDYLALAIYVLGLTAPIN